jgi:signal transduction histidine kinase
MRISLAPRRLFGRVAFLIVGVALLQFAATIMLYGRISRDSVREDHARRVAELLEVSERLHAEGQPDLARIMSTKHLEVWVTPHPEVAAHSTGEGAAEMAALVREWEPTLAASPLHMDVERRDGRDHLIGSMRVRDGSWLNFRSTDLSSPWPIVASASLVTLVLTALLVLFATLALWQLGAPLRRLTEATNRIGEGGGVVLEEQGSTDLRNLSRAFNAMQERIARMLADQAKAFVAISHDLRTPLSRLKLGVDFIEPEDMRDLVDSNVDEMAAMIASLQLFLQVEDEEDSLQDVDLSDIVREASSRWEDRVRIHADESGARAVTYPNVLRLALEPLIENAVQYGEYAEVSVSGEGASALISIRDRGPGLDDEHLPELIEPFFRGDLARARNTPGFGLGIPRAHRLLQRFGGAVSFSRGPDGGLQVAVRPPMREWPAAEPQRGRAP